MGRKRIRVTTARPIAEAGEAAPSRLAVRVIRSGRSGNGRDYPPDVLRGAVPLFEGARVFATHDAEHIESPYRDASRMVGRLAAPEYVRTGSGGEIRAALELVHPEGELAQWLVSAVRRDMQDAFGLSISASARVRRGRVEAIESVSSVDLVVHPAAGGGVLSIIEAMKMPNPSKDKMDTKAAERRVQLTEARVQVAESGLPKKARKRLKKRLKNSIDISEAAVTGMIEDERERIAEANYGHPGAAVVGLGGTSRISITEGREKRIPKMLDALLDPRDASVTSIKESYISITGDKRVTGQLANCDRRLVAEAISIGTGSGAGVFAELFGDSITRRMQREYREAGAYDWFKKVCTEVPASDFREQKRPYWGGYGNLPTVAQAAAYPALTSPTDVEESYTVTKRGGTETITLEAIKNDDVGVVMRLPRRLARAAKRTLSDHIAGLFTMGSGAGPTLSADSLTLFHATHNNRGSAALSSASVAAGRLAMLQQTERDSAKRLEIEPRALLVPRELQETGFNLFTRGTRNDKDFVASFEYDVTPVPGWTDTNDWVLCADPMDIETIEIGYLDGMMEPEIFVQNAEEYGSMFSNDRWTYKIRHIYGATVMDFRGFYKGLVT